MTSEELIKIIFGLSGSTPDVPDEKDLIYMDHVLSVIFELTDQFIKEENNGTDSEG